MEPGAPELSVVVPLYRSRATVEPLYERVCAALPRERVELLFVDDHCPEGSFDAAKALAARDARVRAARLAHNVGQQRAVLFGLGAARGRWIAVMDADLQDDPAHLPLLVQRARQGADLVFATRNGRYESAARLRSSRLFKTLLGRLTGMPSNAGMFFLASAELMGRVVARSTSTPYLVFLTANAARHLACVEVERSARGVGRSAYTGRARLGVALRALRCVAATRLGLTSTPPPPTVERSAGW